MYLYDDYVDLHLRTVERGAALPRMGGALSPDIVPWGVVSDTDAAPVAAPLPPQWDRDPGQALVPGVPNSIYLRCRNGGGNELPGHLYLAAGPACMPCWPDQLTPVPTPAGRDYASIKVPGGKSGVTSTPFLHVPESATDTLAAWIVTSKHPLAPPEATRSVHRLRTFFETTAGYVQRSVGFGIEGEYCHAARYEQRDAAAMMQLELRFHDCPRRWTLSVLPDDPMGPLQIEPFDVSAPAMSVVVRAMVPAGYIDTLTLRIDSRGIPAPSPARVDMVLSLVVADALDDATVMEGGGLMLGIRRPPAAFRLGSHSWRARSPESRKDKAGGALRLSATS